jgi:hypothetical protein
VTAHDRASVLRKRIAEIKDAQKFEKHAAALEDKRRALETSGSDLQSAVAPARVLVKNQCLKPDLLPDPQKLDDALKKIIEGFTDDPGSITKGRNFTTLCGHLETTANDLREVTMGAWKKEVSAAPKTNDSLLDKIAQLRGQHTDVEQLRIAAVELAEASMKPPDDQNGWTNYQALVQRVKEKVEKLSAEHFPKSVLDFCIAAQSNGAQLSMLTDEVSAWLTENGMLDDLRYRFR